MARKKKIKQVAVAYRSRKRPEEPQKQRLNPGLYGALITAMQDARPISTSEHYTYKDAQHKECVRRIGAALASIVKPKSVTPQVYADNFYLQVRGIE